MQNNKCFFLVFLFVVATKCGYSQQQESSADEARGKKYSLLLYLSGGAGYFPSNSGAPTYLQPKRTRINPVLTARVMWKPDHRLKAGLETGFVTFYSYRLTDENG
ncbi:MAG TPA: hypothetical protein VF610_09735, partial [Segetibacter sp.]